MSGQYLHPPVPGALIIQVFPGIHVAAMWYERAKIFLRREVITPFDCVAAIARSNDTNAMRHYLNQKGDVNLSSPVQSGSLLQQAVWGGSLAMVQLLLAQPAISIEIPDTLGETVIFDALRRKAVGSTREETAVNATEKLQILDALLSKNPNLSLSNRYGETPLIFAARQTLDILNRVLAHNPPLFPQSNARESALTIAARSDVAQKASLIFQRIQPGDGLALRVRDRSNCSLLRLATSHTMPSILTSVLEAYKRCGVRLLPQDFSDAWSGLPRVNYGQDEKKVSTQIKNTIRIADLLFAEGATLNDEEPAQGMTPLIIATEARQWDLAVYFLNYPVHAQPPANCELISARGWNVLCYLIDAIQHMSPEDWQIQREKITAVYQIVLTRMSAASIAHTAAQMNLPVARLQGQDINTLRLQLPPMAAEAMPLHQALGAAAAAAAPAPVLIDRQSTHRREVHLSTTECARVLYARHANTTGDAQLTGTPESCMAYYTKLAWLSDPKRAIYINNLENTLEHAIPGDEGGQIRAHLASKLALIKQCIQNSKQVLTAHLTFLYRAVEPAGEARAEFDRAFLAEQQQFRKKSVLHDWAAGSVVRFLLLIMQPGPYKDWSDPQSGVTVAQALGLLWSAIHAPEYALTDEQKDDLKVQIGLVIIDAMHENGRWSTSCAPGAFNALMDVAARSGYIPGLYVLSNAAEGAAIKLQLTEKLSLQAHFNRLNAEQKIEWFESFISYESARQACFTEQQIFRTLGENQRFKFFTDEELTDFSRELQLEWVDWKKQNEAKRPTLEDLTVSRLKGMNESERQRILSRKRKDAPASDERDLILEAGLTRKRRRSHIAQSTELPMEGAPMDQRLDDQQEVVSVLAAEASAPMDLDGLAAEIMAMHPIVVQTPQFDRLDRHAIRQQFGIQETVYDLIDYSSQTEGILHQPGVWVNKHWNAYYTELTHEALNQLLPKVGLKPIGTREVDLKYYAERDRDRLFAQCSLDPASEPGKTVFEHYQVWLDNLDVPEASPRPTT